MCYVGSVLSASFTFIPNGVSAHEKYFSIAHRHALKAKQRPFSKTFGAVNHA